MYFCRSWFWNMVSFRYVLVFLNFLHDIFSIKFYTISFLWDLFTISFTIFLLMRNITRWMLDTEVKVFHESISYFMKWPWNCISWNALKEKFHSVSFLLEILQNLQENTCSIVSFLIKRKLWHKCFPLNFAKFLRTLFLQNTSGRLLLNEHRI